ncbi:MAG: hypothetical protein R2834_19415 [Rhodothermales bacterium]
MHATRFPAFLLLILLLPCLSCAEAQPVSIGIDLDTRIGAMYPMWAYWGYDEPNYTYMANGRKLIREISELSPVPVYFRAHSMLNTDEGPRAALKWGSTNAYTEDAAGNPVYDWTIVDRIVDTYVENGAKPMMEVGFMPKALSSKPEPYRHHWSPADPYGDIFTGWAYPPKDYAKWAELIFQWVRHSVDRYGADEVATWWWDVWNEPDIPYWKGTREEYFTLYDYTADAIKRALPAARVGGPTTTNPGLGDDASGRFLADFLAHCSAGTNYATGQTGSPLDFISFHAKGSPRVMDDGRYVRMNMAPQLDAIDAGFQIVAASPFKALPIIIGESDPEGCAACSVDYHPANAYRNGTMYASYTASSFAKKYELADRRGINLEGAVSWSFQFEGKPWFAGFRAMATNGVDKPVLNVFRMFGMMGGDRVAVSPSDAPSAERVIQEGVRGDLPDINALASRDGDAAYVMVWNYHDDDLPALAADVSVHLKGIPAGRVKLSHYRIDENHSNAYTVWREMGAPQQVTREQYARLEASGQLELLTSPMWIDAPAGEATIAFSLPRQGVSLLQLSW